MKGSNIWYLHVKEISLLQVVSPQFQNINLSLEFISIWRVILSKPKLIPGLLLLLSDLKTKTVSLNVIEGFLDKDEDIARLLKLTSAEVVKSWEESDWCFAELKLSQFELSSKDFCFKIAGRLYLMSPVSSISSCIEPNLTEDNNA